MQKVLLQKMTSVKYSYVRICCFESKITKKYQQNSKKQQGINKKRAF